MNTIVDKQRSARKCPKILKLIALKIRGLKPNCNIVVLEGEEDVPVYEVWLSRISNTIEYQIIPGKGKEQLLNFHKDLTDVNDPLKENLFFFIDRDFDLPVENHPAIYELPMYSIENILCSEYVLDSILKDEFRCSAEIEDREVILEKYKKLRADFYDLAKPVNFSIFVARRMGVDLMKKPSRVRDFMSIGLTEIALSVNSLDDIVQISSKIAEDYLNKFKQEFELMSSDLTSRGKYELDMFRDWLANLHKDRVNSKPVLFRAAGKVKGDPANLEMRRLATASKLPLGLTEFVKQSFLMS